MTILARFQNQQVEVIDTFEAGGIELAAVKAITGKPFVGGDKWPVFTEWATVKTCELQALDPTPQPLTNLLTMALQYASKTQWAAGEDVWIWRNNGKGGAFLKECNGWVNLFLTGYKRPLPVFWLNPSSWKWEARRNVSTDYQAWAARAKVAK